MPPRVTVQRHHKPTDPNDHHDDGFPPVEPPKDGRADCEQGVFGRSQYRKRMLIPDPEPARLHERCRHCRESRFRQALP